MTDTPIWDRLIAEVRGQPVYAQLSLLFGEANVDADRTVDIPDPGVSGDGAVVAGDPPGEGADD